MGRVPRQAAGPLQREWLHRGQNGWKTRGRAGMRPETLRSEAVMAMTEKHETPSKSKGGAAKGAVRGVSIRVIGAITTAIAVVLAFYAFTIAGYVSDARETAEFDESRYVQCSAAINDLQAASDYLTTQTRMFVVTGERSCLE